MRRPKACWSRRKLKTEKRQQRKKSGGVGKRKLYKKV